MLPKDELPSIATFGVAYTSISVHPPTYLKWLQSEVQSRGVKFVKRRLASIEQALEYAEHQEDTVVVVNATGLGIYAPTHLVSILF